MIIPCIDLMGGKVVQLIQGREKALEAEGPLEMLEKFRVFPQVQVIDLDAALGKNQDKGSNDELVEIVARRAIARVGGGVRSPQRARALIEQGAYRVIVGTATFDREKLTQIADAVGPDRLVIALDSKGGKVVTHGWQETTNFVVAMPTAIQIVSSNAATSQCPYGF